MQGWQEIVHLEKYILWFHNIMRKSTQMFWYYTHSKWWTMLLNCESGRQEINWAFLEKGERKRNDEKQFWSSRKYRAFLEEILLKSFLITRTHNFCYFLAIHSPKKSFFLSKNLSQTSSWFALQLMIRVRKSRMKLIGSTL